MVGYASILSLKILNQSQEQCQKDNTLQISIDLNRAKVCSIVAWEWRLELELLSAVEPRQLESESASVYVSVGQREKQGRLVFIFLHVCRVIVNSVVTIKHQPLPLQTKTTQQIVVQKK